MTRESLIRVVCSELNKFSADLIAFWRKLFSVQSLRREIEKCLHPLTAALIYAARRLAKFILSDFAQEKVHRRNAGKLKSAHTRLTMETKEKGLLSKRLLNGWKLSFSPFFDSTLYAFITYCVSA